MSHKPKPPPPGEPDQQTAKHPPKPPRNPFSAQAPDRRGRSRNDNHVREVRHK